MSSNILIVEDESIVALEISSFVKELGYSVVGSVSNSLSALKMVDENHIDLVLMDVHIKGDDDGITCAESIKKIKDIPIIYISAFSDDVTLERAIQTNPSAYLVKPFNPRELKVAISIATKKEMQEMRVGDIVFDKEFSFDTKTDELICLGESIHLTKQEQNLLSFLLDSKNTTISLYEVENEIWPDKTINDNTRRGLVSRLRSKLKYRFLQTEHSIGYRLDI